MLRGWQKLKERNVLARQRAALVIEAMTDFRCAQCFSAWRKYVADAMLKQLVFQRKQHAIHRALIIGGELARTRRRQTLKTCFRGWHRWAHIMGCVHKMWEAIGRRLINTAWRSWRDYLGRLQDIRQRDTMAASFWCRRAYLTVFRSWHLVVMQYKKHRSHVCWTSRAHILQVRKRQVLQAWSKHCATLQDILKKVQVCKYFSGCTFHPRSIRRQYLDPECYVEGLVQHCCFVLSRLFQLVFCGSEMVAITVQPRSTRISCM